VAVEGIIRGIEVENDLFGRRLVRFEEQLDEQGLDRCRIMPDLVVTARLRRRVLEPVERALAGKRCAVLTLRLKLAGQGCQHRVEAQLVVVDQILIAKRDAEHPLRHHGLHRVFDLPWRATIGEAGGEPSDQTDRPIGRAEQQAAGIRGDLAAVERSHHLTALDHFITEQVAATLCRHRGPPLRQLKSLWQKSYARFRAPMHRLPGRVEEGRGSRLRQLRLPSPLVKPDVRISRIRLSDWLHREAHGGGPK
jgi:hypothetical protein